MSVVIACGVLLIVGLVAIVRWGHLDVHSPAAPATDGKPPVSFIVRRYIWTVSLLLWTTVITAVLIVGPAGRLAMRLLAVTAGSAAQGRQTEAQEVVGRISVGGTIGLFIFVGLFGGFVSVVAFMVIRRWLPAGRWGGLLLGAILLVTLGTRIDPLRADNVDFDVVGPGWVSVTVYSAMALVQGMAVVAVAGRLSQALPLPGKQLRTIAPHVVLLLLVAASFLLPVVVVLGAVIVLVSRTDVAAFLRSRQSMIAGRAVLAAITVVALPGFASAVWDILHRGP